MVRTAKFGISAITAFLIFLLPSTIVAVGASKEEVRQIIEFVQREGRPNTIPGAYLFGLDIIKTVGGPGAPALTKIYKVGADIHEFVISTVNGRREFIAMHYRGDFFQSWRLDDKGKVLNTVQVDDAQKVTKSSGLMYESDLASVLATILRKSAKAPIKKD